MSADDSSYKGTDEEEGTVASTEETVAVTDKTEERPAKKKQAKSQTTKNKSTTRKKAATKKSSRAEKMYTPPRAALEEVPSEVTAGNVQHRFGETSSLFDALQSRTPRSFIPVSWLISACGTRKNPWVVQVCHTQKEAHGFFWCSICGKY